MILSFNGKESKEADGSDLAMLSRPGKSTVAEYLAFSKHRSKLDQGCETELAEEEVVTSEDIYVRTRAL